MDEATANRRRMQADLDNAHVEGWRRLARVDAEDLPPAPENLFREELNAMSLPERLWTIKLIRRLRETGREPWPIPSRVPEAMELHYALLRGAWSGGLSIEEEHAIRERLTRARSRGRG
jgi:hypothetical protein